MSYIKKIECPGPDIDYLEILYRPSTLCNYDCSYCVQKNNKSDIDVSVVQERINTELAYVLDIINKANKLIIIKLTGGEPSLYDYSVLSSGIKDLEEQVRVEITTNLSADVSYYKNLVASFDADYPNPLRKFSIVASYHQKDTDNFVNKALELNNYFVDGTKGKSGIKVEFVVNDDIIDDVVNVMTTLIDGGFPKDKIVVDYDKFSDFTQNDKLSDLGIEHLFGTDNLIVTMDDNSVVNIPRREFRSKGGFVPTYWQCTTKQLDVEDGLVYACPSKLSNLGSLKDISESFEENFSVKNICYSPRKCGLCGKSIVIENVKNLDTSSINL